MRNWLKKEDGRWTVSTSRRFDRIAAPVALLLLGGLLFGSRVVHAIGGYLFEDPITHKSYPNKTVAGYLGVQSGGTVEVQTGSQPTEGQALIAGCGTASGTSTSTASCAQFRTLPASEPPLPAGTPGQVLGVTTITVSATTTSTATATAVGTAYQPVNGTLYAGSNIRLTTGTDTNTATAAELASGPRVHAVGLEPTLPVGTPGQVVCYTGTGTGTSTSKTACNQSTGAALSFSTSTPASVGTSGSVGTSTLLNRSDHRHQGDGNDKVAAYAGQTPGDLEDVTASADGSIVISEFSGKMSFVANFGTSAHTVCQGDDSRLSNARTPTAHASTHVTGGGDTIANAVAGGNAGLLSGADKAKMDRLGCSVLVDVDLGGVNLSASGSTWTNVISATVNPSAGCTLHVDGQIQFNTGSSNQVALELLRDGYVMPSSRRYRTVTASVYDSLVTSSRESFAAGSHVIVMRYTGSSSTAVTISGASDADNQMARLRVMACY